VTKDKAMAKRYDQLAYDFIKISLTAYSITAILGGILIFTFLTLYPAFFGYLSGIFRPVMHIYALMFVAESGTLYIYYYGWDKMKEGFLKWIHLSMSVILNVIGTLLMFLANSWIGFMMSPAGVDEQGRYLGNIWHVIHTALWNPLNVHRILGNMAFGGGVVAAYAAYKFLASKTDEDRAHYDWMGYIAMALGVAFLIPLPFAGYWLMREVYAYRQQMGITLMGGLLAWLFIIQATMIGILFLSSNYYLWQALGRMRGAEKYQRYIKYLVFLLVVGFLVFITPHTIVMTPAELKAMGGQQHPVLGNKLTEFAILIAARDWTNNYEWNAHAPAANRAGLSPALVADIAAGRRPDPMSEDEQIVYDFCAELLHNKSVSDATYARALAKFGEPGVVELANIEGYYVYLSMVMNTARSPLPAGAKPQLERFPK